MAKLGGVWTENTEFHYIDAATNNEWYFIGVFVSTPANAKQGSIWVEGEDFCYIDGSGDKRKYVGELIGVTSGKAGSVWDNATFFRWISETLKHIKGHQDTAHGDTAGHTDSPGHSDGTFVDTAHGDTAHTDHHRDWEHGDFHNDSHSDHNDFHGDHFDGLSSPFHVDSIDHYDGHGDTSHDDFAHGDDHNNIAHSDFAHGDVSHGDTAHGDGGGVHSDIAHADQPVLVGP